MKKSIPILFISITVIVVAVWFVWRLQPQEEPAAAPLSQQQTMTIRSSAFQHNGSIPKMYTCDGDNSAPPLAIADVPASAKSLALIVDDPDAPRGTWVHWLVWNLPSGTTAFGEGNVLPRGALEGTTDFGKTGYGGPCPPSGAHRYFFKLYALDIAALPLVSTARKANLERAMDGHILATAELIGLYTRR